jgi:hypothetical protein
MSTPASAMTAKSLTAAELKNNLFGDQISIHYERKRWWHRFQNPWREFVWRCRYDLLGVIEERPRLLGEISATRMPAGSGSTQTIPERLEKYTGELPSP